MQDTAANAPAGDRRAGQRIGAWMPFLAILVPINLILSVDRNAFVIVASQIQSEFGFSLTRMSYVLASISWTYAAFQLPSGWLVQRFGFRRLMAVALVGWSIAIGFMPLATGFWSLLLLRLLLGAAQAPDWPSSIAAIRAWFPLAQRSRCTAIALSGQYIGPVIGSIVTGSVTYRYGWRVCFYAYAVLGIALALMWIAGTRSVAAPAVAPAGPPKATTGTTSFPAFLKLPNTWAMAALYFCLICTQSFFLSWLPTYLVQEKGVTLSASGWYTAIPWLTLYVSVTLAGFVADHVLTRTGSLKLARLPAAVVGFCLGGVSLSLVPWLSSMAAVIATLCLSLAGVGIVQSMVWSTVQDIGGDRTPVLVGWTAFWGNFSAGLFPIVMAYLVKWSGGWQYALLVPLVFSAIGIGLVFCLRLPRHAPTG